MPSGRRTLRANEGNDRPAAQLHSLASEAVVDRAVVFQRLGVAQHVLAVGLESAAEVIGEQPGSALLAQHGFDALLLGIRRDGCCRKQVFDPR